MYNQLLLSYPLESLHKEIFYQKSVEILVRLVRTFKIPQLLNNDTSATIGQKNMSK